MLRLLLISAGITGVLAYAYTFTAWQALPLLIAVVSLALGVGILMDGDMDEGGALLTLSSVMALVTAAAGFI